MILWAGTGLAAAPLLGNDSVASSPDSDPAGLAEAFNFTASGSGTAGTIWVYVDRGSSSTALIAGLYADNGGHPGSLLASGSNSAPSAGQWDKVALDSTSAISSGTPYWLAVLGTGGQLNFRDVDPGTGRCSENSFQTNLPSLPSSWTSGTAWTTCSPSAFVTATGSTTTTPAPGNISLPTIGGQAVQRQTLTASNGAWSGSPTFYAYQWQDCDSSGNNCTDVGGATSSSYTLASGDVGDTMRVVVTATNTGGATSATSVATGIVSAPTAPPPSPPSNTALPALQGTAQQGQTLTATSGSWSGSPTVYAYQWQDCDRSGNNCTDVTGAISSSYVLTSGDIGVTVRVVVTATNPRGSTTATARATPVVTSSAGTLVLPHDPSFVGPSYYSKFSNGPSSSMTYFPIYTYQLNLGQWNQLASRITGMGVNGIDDAYNGSSAGDAAIMAANGLNVNVAGGLPGSNSQVVTSYAMQDEPNSTGSGYAASSCTPSDDTCAQAYVNDANAYRSTDPTRPVWGNFTDCDVNLNYLSDCFPPSGWNTAQTDQHNKTMMSALDIVSADSYAWTSPWEWNEISPNAPNDNYGAWVYGFTQNQLRTFAPGKPTYGFIECCDSGDGSGATPPTNEMMPGMIQASMWNLLAHGARGIVYWTTNFWDSNSGGDPFADPYPGATYTGSYALYAEHQWDAQYAAAQSVNLTAKADAVDLNSPTISGITAKSSSGVPVATLGKDVNGKLWLLAQADGNHTYQLSNTSPMTATITLPAAVPPGTVLDVVGENRTVTVNSNNQITDTFGTTTETPTYSGTPITYGYQHHIYAMP